MALKVFVLGRPGSGKSTATHRIAKSAQRRDLSTTRINDYEILHKWFRQERDHPRNGYKYFCPTDHNGFDVIDFSVLPLALQEVEKRVQIHSSSKVNLVLIEFARDDYCEVLRTFSYNFLHDAYFLFLNAEIDICIQRVHERITYPATPDDHFVSDGIIKSYYHKDNKPYIISQLAQDYNLDDKRVRVIDNTVSHDSFLQKIDDFFDFLFSQELETSRKTSLLQGSSASARVMIEPVCSFNRRYVDVAVEVGSM